MAKDLKTLIGDELYTQIEPKLDGVSVIIDDGEGKYITNEEYGTLTKAKKDLETANGEVSRLDGEIANLKTTHMKDTAIANALYSAKTKNTKAARALLDESKIVIGDDGSISGLDEQVKAVQESDPYLFGEDGEVDTGSNGAHRRNDGTTPQTLKDAISNYYSE